MATKTRSSRSSMKLESMSPKASDEKAKASQFSTLMMLSSQLLSTGRCNGGLPSFITKGMDSEQIWQQLELRNEHKLALSGCTKEIVNIQNRKKRFVKKAKKIEEKKIKNIKNSSDKETDSDSTDSDSSEDEVNVALDSIKKRLARSGGDDEDELFDFGGSEDEDDLDFDFAVEKELSKGLSGEDSDDESSSSKNKVKKKKPKRTTVVDDKFFKMADMEEFLDAEDTKEEKKMKQEKLGLEDKDSSDEEEEEEEFDMFAADSEDDDDEDNEAKYMYSDFFDPVDDEGSNKENDDEGGDDVKRKKKRLKKGNKKEELKSSEEDEEEEILKTRKKKSKKGKKIDSDESDEEEDVEEEDGEEDDDEEEILKPKNILSRKDKKFEGSEDEDDEDEDEEDEDGEDEDEEDEDEEDEVTSKPKKKRLRKEESEEDEDEEITLKPQKKRLRIDESEEEDEEVIFKPKKKRSKKEESEDEEEDDDDDDDDSAMDDDGGNEEEAEGDFPGADDDEEENANDVNAKSKKKVSFRQDLLQSDDDDDAEDDNVQFKKPEQKSTFETKQEKLRARAKEMEELSLRETPWELTGETSSVKRPENSLLETVLDFQHTTRAAPVITDDTTKSLEDFIKQRIKDKTFDDVERKDKPKEDVFEFKKRIVLDQEKSKQSLGELYEQEFLKQQQQDVEEVKADPECEKIESDLNKLFFQLDALSNFRYTPMRPGTEVKVIVNTPAIAMEEVAPVATTDSDLLAPQEVHEKRKGELKADDERDATDKKRARRQKKMEKRERKKAKESREKLVEKLKPGMGNKYSKKKALKQLEEISKSSKNVTMIQGTNKKMASSTAFFSELQDEVQTKVKARRGAMEKKKKRVDPSKLML